MAPHWKESVQKAPLLVNGTTDEPQTKFEVTALEIEHKHFVYSPRRTICADNASPNKSVCLPLQRDPESAKNALHFHPLKFRPLVLKLYVGVRLSREAEI